MAIEVQSALEIQVAHELWERGDLEWLLYDHQLPIYNKLHEIIADPDPTINSYYLDIARQYGKSFTLFLVCCELCLRNSNYTICYIAPQKGMALEIVTQYTFNTIFANCPEKLLPKLSNKHELEFKNGSRIRLSGADNKHYESLRGGRSNLNVIDEAGFMDNLIDGVLNATDPMLKTTGGKTLYASTPAATMDHDSEIIYKQHKEANLVSTFTIDDDKQMSEADLQREINKCHGRHTTKFKREYLCEHISDASKQVIGELTKERMLTARLPANYRDLDQFYQYWKKYIVLDWGGRDHTAVLFGYFNFHTKECVVESELTFAGTEVHLAMIADAIKQRTELLWTPAQQHNGIAYYCDNNNPLAQQDLNVKHGLSFVPTTKGYLDAMVQMVKNWFADDRVKFASGAEFALKSAESAHWASQRDKFAQSKIYGHYDHLAALVYFIRNIDQYTDPVPKLLGVRFSDTFVSPSLRKEAMQQHQQIAALFDARGRSRNGRRRIR